MSNLVAIDASLMQQVAGTLERLSKSFAAGYHGLQNAGRTGVGALAIDHIDPVIRTITLEESDFLLTKDIPTLKATQTTYSYTVKTAVRSGVDLAGWEAFLPQEDTSQYMRVAEVLKVYGIKKSITQMSQLVNDAGGYMVDLEKENDTNAALAMAEAMERDLYVGGDLFISPTGEIDGTIAANINGPLRQVRGIQANVREGDQSQRGIPGDFKGYGNNRSVVQSRKGGVLNRAALDKLVTAIRDSRGNVREAHCTTSQLAEFRATFFPFERGNLAEMYAIRGAGITNDEHARLPIDTVAGTIDFIPTVFKYNRLYPEVIIGSAATPPATPGPLAVAAGGVGSGFKAGEVYRYLVQAVNIGGTSSASASVAFTVVTDDVGIDLTIPNVTGAEYYRVFRTPVEANGLSGKEMFLANVLPTAGATTVFRDLGRLVPGLDSVLFLPRDKHRAKLAILGNLLNKLALGVRGLAFEHCYASYFGCVVDRPRSFGIMDAVYQQREGL